MKAYRYLLILCGLIFLTAKVHATPEQDSIKQAKDLSQYVFRDTLGKECKIESLKGNYVFLEMWSMSCGPCLRQMPYFKKLSQQYKDHPICFISICVENNFPAWRKFLKQRNMTGIHWITPILSPFLKENGFIAVPRFVLLDKEGRILWNRAKQPSDPDLKKDLDNLFK